MRMTLAPAGSLRARWLRRLYNILPGRMIRLARRMASQRDLALLRSSPLFDRDWYLAHNPDVVGANADPAFHYLHYGGFQERDPGPNFCSSGYLDAYPDVRAAGMNPLLHYLKFGRQEGRTVHASSGSTTSEN